MNALCVAAKTVAQLMVKGVRDGFDIGRCSGNVGLDLAVRKGLKRLRMAGIAVPCVVRVSEGEENSWRAAINQDEPWMFKGGFIAPGHQLAVTCSAMLLLMIELLYYRTCCPVL